MNRFDSSGGMRAFFMQLNNFENLVIFCINGICFHTPPQIMVWLKVKSFFIDHVGLYCLYLAIQVCNYNRWEELLIAQYMLIHVPSTFVPETFIRVIRLVPNKNWGYVVHLPLQP